MTTRNSDLVANLEASPQVANKAQELQGVVRIAQGNVALLAGDSTNGDIVMLAPVPSNATIMSLRVGTDALGGSCTYDVGIYTDAGGVKDIDFFATSVADGAAVAELRYEAANLNTTGQQLYTMAGDSTDPGGFYYIAATFDATGGTAGDMAFIIEYVVN
jgi:porphobilinogen deaminase|tara:strand:- start:4719 stop:5198 length:480 start_codon:yes stop_codon:yes gene_type:complete